jgi:hypothetical protein
VSLCFKIEIAERVVVEGGDGDVIWEREKRVREMKRDRECTWVPMIKDSLHVVGARIVRLRILWTGDFLSYLGKLLKH